MALQRKRCEIERELDELWGKYEVLLEHAARVASPNLAEFEQAYAYLRALDAGKVTH